MLTFKIDGRWEPEDFIALLSGVESLYYKATISGRYYPFYEEALAFGQTLNGLSYEDRLAAGNAYLLQAARFTVSADRRLYVTRIQYASPGGVDVAGLGAVAEALYKSLQLLLTFIQERRLRQEGDKQAKIETEIKGESLRAIQIENAEKLLRLRREFPDDIVGFLLPLAVEDQRKLTSLMLEGKLVGVEYTKTEDSTS